MYTNLNHHLAQELRFSVLKIKEFYSTSEFPFDLGSSVFKTVEFIPLQIQKRAVYSKLKENCQSINC